jgi:hypothetical protein
VILCAVIEYRSLNGLSNLKRTSYSKDLKLPPGFGFPDLVSLIGFAVLDPDFGPLALVIPDPRRLRSVNILFEVR